MIALVIFIVALALVAAIVGAVEARLRGQVAAALAEVRGEAEAAYVCGPPHAQKPLLISRRGATLTLWSVDAAGATALAELPAREATIVEGRVRSATLRTVRGIVVSGEDPEQPSLDLALYRERWPLLVALSESEIGVAIEALSV